MKKLILFAAILFAGVSVVNAQQVEKEGNYTTIPHKDVSDVEGDTENSAQTSLKVTLNSVQSISVNTSEVHLEYKTIEDYQLGVKTPLISEHLNVYSTGGYEVSVYYDNASGNTGSSDNALTTEALFETIKVKVTGGAEVSLKNSENKQVVASSNTGAYNKMYPVEYIGSGIENNDGMGYMNNIAEGVQKVYTANVIYTIDPA